MWIDGMRWFTLGEGGPTIARTGLIGINEPPEDAFPDLAHPDTLDALANRVRYLYELPDLVAVYEERTSLYKVTLPNGAAVARYSAAGAWVGLLELWSYRTEMRKIGRTA
jgi:hypothetical protein